MPEETNDDCFCKIKRLQMHGKKYKADSWNEKHIQQLKREIEEKTKLLDIFLAKEVEAETKWTEKKLECESMKCTGVKQKGFTSKKSARLVVFESDRKCSICDWVIYGKSDGVAICDEHFAHKECAMSMSRNVAATKQQQS